jgi:DNA-damage-inducible protein D
MNTKEILAEITNKAKDFAAEMTSVNVQAKDLQGETQITREHVDNNAAVRQMLVQRGIVPEDLPPAEDVKQLLEQRVQSQACLTYVESRQKSTKLR